MSRYAEKDYPVEIPSIYLTGYMNDFEEYIQQFDVKKALIKKDDYLTQYGTINNTAYYVKRGIIHLSLGHEAGKKSLNFFGSGTIFPIGVEVHEAKAEYEMIIQAFTDVELYKFSYPTLKKMVRNNGDFSGELFRENCDFIGYMFFDAINQTFEPCLTRICDILWLYLKNISEDNNEIDLSQAELASLVGVSKAHMERSIKLLKSEGVIRTSRGKIEICDQKKLLKHCTNEMQQIE